MSSSSLVGARRRCCPFVLTPRALPAAGPVGLERADSGRGSDLVALDVSDLAMMSGGGSGGSSSAGTGTEPSPRSDSDSCLDHRIVCSSFCLLLCLQLGCI